MKTYHVFIDRTQDRSPGAEVQVAARIAARFGIPAAQVEDRLRAGRFRVKAGVDLPTAQRVVTELEGLGAVCSVMDSARADAAGPAAAPALSRLPTPPPIAKAGAGAADPPAASKGPPAYQSGLAAARAAPAEHALGALADGALSSGTFKLTTLDGDADDSAPVTGSRSPGAAPEPPDDDGLLTLMEPGQAPAAPAPPPPARPPAPRDLFAPPEMAADDPVLEVSALPARPAPPPEPEPELDPAASSVGSLTLHAEESRVDRLLTALADRPRARFVAGLLLALVLGFIPAHVVSALRESAAYSQIQGELREQYARVTTSQELSGAEMMRAAKLDQMRSKQVGIAITACVLWALIGAGFAYLWFRRVDWSRYASLSPRSSSSSRSAAASSA